MKLFELDQTDAQTGFYDPNADKIDARKLSDTRKPVLTLKKINKLKKMKALKTLENLKRHDLLSLMYGQEADGGGGGGMGGF